MLPDIALLDIFEFYMNGNQEAWQILVHVCQNWRTVVFGSPRRLDLRLFCTTKTPVGEMLDIWPLLPIVVRVEDDEEQDVDNIIAALEHNDRICQLDLKCPRFQMERVLAAMQKPFPILTYLNLCPGSKIAPIDPDLFLGGSAPQLQTLILYNISFPGLPKLLLSATQLVLIDLWSIRPFGYISPGIMLSCLTVLTRLERLKIGFKYLQSRSNLTGQSPPLVPRVLLPILTEFRFKGLPEYLEVLVARIDAPLLNNLNVIFFFYEPIIASSQLIQFIDRTPKLKAHDQVRVVIDPNSDAWVTLPQSYGGKLRLKIIHTDSPSDQLSSVAQFCNSSIPRDLISGVECLYIAEGDSHYSDFEEDAIEDSPVQWVELLRPFTAVKRLYISLEFTPHLVLALQELVRERVTEVLPTLETLFLEEPQELGPEQDGIEQFVAARRLVDQCVTLSHWNGIKDVRDEMED